MSAVLNPTLPVAPAAAVAAAAPPTPVPPAVGPQPLRFTREQYRALAGLTELRDLRTVLVDGVIYVMANPAPPHSVALGTIDDWLRTVFATRFHVRNQMPFHVGERTDPNPDLAVVEGPRNAYLSRDSSTAVLVVEVADSSLFFDTTTKAEVYATAGVRDYWVADLDGRRLLVYRDPEPLAAGLGATAYRTHRAYGPDDTVAPLAAPTAEVRVADLLP